MNKINDIRIQQKVELPPNYATRYMNYGMKIGFPHTNDDLMQLKSSNPQMIQALPMS